MRFIPEALKTTISQEGIKEDLTGIAASNPNTDTGCVPVPDSVVDSKEAELDAPDPETVDNTADEDMGSE